MATGAAFFADTDLSHIQTDIDVYKRQTQYSLTLILELEGEQKVYYYTTILWNDDVHISEILEFATEDVYKRQEICSKRTPSY